MAHHIKVLMTRGRIPKEGIPRAVIHKQDIVSGSPLGIHRSSFRSANHADHGRLSSTHLGLVRYKIVAPKDIP